MNTTRASLLIRVKNPRDTQAWAQFYDLYGPLLYRYARAKGLSHEDAEDVQSTCYEQIVRQIRHFDYDRQKGGFKAWLRTLVARRVTDLLRKHREPVADSQDIRAASDPEPAPDELWEQHWKLQHLRYCVEQVRDLVSPDTFQAFQMLIQEGSSVPNVCERLGWNANQVYKAKARVLQLVRQQMATLYSEVGK
jgi:RNA polymerase sigma-70 factor (ECF subfamily)